MTFKRHIRISLQGTLGDGREIFSFGISMQSFVDTWLEDLITPDFPPDAITDDWRDHCVDYFSSACKIRNNAHLRRITIAQIGPDGHYEHAPKEYAPTVDGGYLTGVVMPFQTALAVTLETDGDLGRVKGRFYLPTPATVCDANTDLISVGDAEGYRDATVSWLNAMSNSVGFDVPDWRVVVASQGRHNANGTVRVGPQNHEVKRVNVGRKLDVIRSRANRATESRTSDAAVNFV
jgi:hypothetical protein